MSSNVFAVDTDGMSKPADRLRELSAQVQQLHMRLLDDLGAVVNPFGDDETGVSLHGQYHPAVEQIGAGLTAMSGVMDSIADGVNTMRTGFHNTEQDAVQATAHLSDELDHGGGSRGPVIEGGRR